MIKNLIISFSSKPLQRVGLIVLLLGVISFILWCIEDSIVFYIDYYSGWSEYRFPSDGQNFIYKVHVYLIPIGLLFTVGYSLILKIKNWIFENR